MLTLYRTTISTGNHAIDVVVGELDNGQYTNYQTALSQEGGRFTTVPINVQGRTLRRAFIFPSSFAEGEVSYVVENSYPPNGHKTKKLIIYSGRENGDERYYLSTDSKLSLPARSITNNILGKLFVADRSNVNNLVDNILSNNQDVKVIGVLDDDGKDDQELITYGDERSIISGIRNSGMEDEIQREIQRELQRENLGNGLNLNNGLGGYLPNNNINNINNGNGNNERGRRFFLNVPGPTGNQMAKVTFQGKNKEYVVHPERRVTYNGKTYESLTIIFVPALNKWIVKEFIDYNVYEF